MRLLTAILLVLPALPAQAEPRQYGNIIYDAPSNWMQGGIQHGARVLTYEAPNDICQFCYVYIGLGASKLGSLDDFLIARAASFVDDEDKAAARIIQNPGPLTLGARKAAMMGVKSDADMQILIGIELKDRYELVVFQGYGYDEAELKTSMSVFQNYTLSMFERLKFVSEGARPLMPRPNPGHLDGLWWGWRTAYNLQLDGTMRLDVDHRRVMFWPDGYFFDGTPPQGLKPIDPKALIATGETGFGIYQDKGSELLLTYVTGETETLTPDGDDWAEGGRVLHKVSALADGATIDGSVSSFFYSGFTPGSGVTGGVSSSSSTTFHPDGTYEGESFGGAFGNFENGAGDLTGGFATDGGDRSHGGTYEIRDGLLIQTPAGGGRPTFSMIFQADTEILIGDQYLTAGQQ